MSETRYGLNSGHLSAGGLVVAVDPRALARSTRLAGGTLVRDIIAVKRSWKFTYTDLPGDTGNVRDGGIGRDDLRDLYDAGGAQTLYVPVEGTTAETVQVLFGETFSEKRVQILPFWRFDVGFTLEEI